MVRAVNESCGIEALCYRHDTQITNGHDRARGRTSENSQAHNQKCENYNKKIVDDAYPRGDNWGVRFAYQLDAIKESDAPNGKHDANASLKVGPQEARERACQQRQENSIDEEKPNFVAGHGLYRGHKMVYERV